jgi:hypothetical protein
MVKAVITMGYNEYAMDLQDAITILELLDKAEIHKSQYHSRTDELPSFTSFHVYSQEDQTDRRTITIMSGDAYRKAKLLGKPDDN